MCGESNRCDWCWLPPSTLRRRNLKWRFHSENARIVFRLHYAGAIWKRNNLKKCWFVFEEHSGREITWLSRAIVFQKLLFSECLPSTLKRKAGVFSNPSGLKSVFEKVRFPDGLVWTVRLTVEIKRFQIPPAWCGWFLVGASGTRLLDPPSTQRSRFLMLTKKDGSLWWQEWTALSNLASCEVMKEFCVGG